MARNRNVTHDEALAAAQELFWRDGYAGVSTREIERKTGLTRFTLQRAYGGKKALFLETLDKYLETKITEFLPYPTHDVLSGLANWFENITAMKHMGEGSDQGCLLRTSVTEFKRGDADVDKRIEYYFSAMRGCFSDALVRGQTQGEVRADLDVEAKADILVAAALGASMMKQAGLDDVATRVMLKSIPKMIGEWAT